jgi:hypothetical protein
VARKAESLNSVPGVEPILISSLIARLPELGTVQNCSALVPNQSLVYHDRAFLDAGRGLREQR